MLLHSRVVLPHRQVAAPRHVQARKSPVFRSTARVVVVRSASEGAPNPLKLGDEVSEALMADFDALTEKMGALSGSLTDRLQGTSLYLIGLMGAGKSTCGRILAKALGYYFFDTDELIEKLTNKSVAQIFAEEGEEEFRTMETDVLKELQQYKSIVVATGGGIPTRRENWGYMQHGVVAWLDGEPELLAKRVVKDGSEKRPLVASDGTGEKSEYEKVVDKLQGLLEKRRAQYGFADLTISLAGEGQDEKTGAPAAVVAFRLMETLDKKLTADAEEREARKNFQIVETTPLPGMRVTTEKEAKLELEVKAQQAEAPATPKKEQPKEKSKGFGKQ